MKKNIIKLFIVISLVFNIAQAALELELTKGIDSAYPISILKFELTKIIQNDLKNSGQFKISEQTLNNTLPKEIKNMDFSAWREFNINALVDGQIQRVNDNQYAINYRLIDLYRNKLNPIFSPLLLHKTYLATPTQFRRVAHKIADEIFQKLIGIPGIFSTKIAYVLVKGKARNHKTYYLEIADADGYQPKPLLISHQPIMSPAWAPDGKKIAYVSFEKRRAAIYVSTLSTGKRQLITRFSGINGAPAWSPDQAKMALVLSKAGAPKIYLLDLKTKKMKQLTQGWSIDTEPAWAPDGKSIIFTSDRSGSPQIYRYYLNNAQIKRLTYVGNYNARASFTPDGKNIVMLHRSQKGFTIAVQNLETENILSLTNTGYEESPSVAPNGQMIIYATREAQNGVLGLVSIDGRVKLHLPETQGEVREPAWAPY